ncbi:MAG: S9 family peptidase [Bacteroidia bacterium]|nr:S9 family peptidase [Bacteroidia bacterium]
MEGIPDIPNPLFEQLAKFTNVRSAVFCDWGPGGKGMIISTRFADVAQLHYVAGPGKDRTQITWFKEPIGTGMSCPDARRNELLFMKDVGGDENYQILRLNLNTNQYQTLTDGKSRHERFKWSTKGDKFAYTGNARNGKDMDIYVHYLDRDVEPELVLKVEGGGWGISDWSRDEKWMIVKNYVSVNESHLYLYDLVGKKMINLIPSEEKINIGEASFSPDGKGIWYVSDEGSEFSHLRYYDIAAKKSTVISGKIPWDAEGFELNAKGDLVAFECNENGYSSLYIYQVKKKMYTRVSQLPEGLFSTMRFHPVTNRLAYTLTTFNSSGDVYVLDADKFLAGGKEVITRWTFSEVGNMDVSKFSKPSIFYYPTFDSSGGKPRMIPCILYKPNRPGKLPVMINIHGGPEGQSKPGFSPLYQYLCNELGVAILVPNVRGSTGYGKTYVTLDNGFLRENSVKDIGKLLDWIALQPELDASKVAVWGGSYGGYMTLACMTHFNDRLKGGIDVVGISNFVTFLKNTSEYRRDLRRVEYGDERDPKMRDFLEKISPNNNVHKITKPMFIVQGLNDPRVPATEAEQMVDALKKNGNPVWYLLGKDEGHGFRKKVNNDFYLASVVMFIREFVVK